MTSTGWHHRRDVEAGPAEVALQRHISQLAAELDQEERDLWKQLRRKRDFEDRVAEKRLQLVELREKRRLVSVGYIEAVASVERLNNDVIAATRQEREMENDIRVLKESNRILQGFVQSQMSGQLPARVSNAGSPQDLLAEERAHKESAQLLQEQIEHLRGHLERLLAEKGALQQRQQALFEKKHAAEQDRNRLLSSLQDDRKSINDLRSERIRLCEERCAMEREMTKIVEEAHFNGQRQAPNGHRPHWSSDSRNEQPGTSGEEHNGAPTGVGGVRMPVAHDTPSAFASCGEVPGSRDGGTFASRASSRGRDAQRPNWTSFEGAGETSSPTKAVTFSGLGSPASFAGEFGCSGDAPSGESNSRRPSSTEPVGSGITEWAGKVRQFRSRGR